VDTHIVYLRHAEEGCVTMRAVCRSFPPPKATVLRVSPPDVTVEADLDPDDLWTPKKAAKGAQREWTPEEFAATFIDGKASKGEVIDRAVGYGISRTKARETLKAALDMDLAEAVVSKDTSAGRPKQVLRRC
ncbi:MAG TPA: hypothetical protein VLA31_01745, partial [Burkholderiaceae bacterium]|nr:hypothetical protein [Burkholderiaceae bacterium]